MATPRQLFSPRWPRWILAAAIGPLCWLGMMAVHEFGHVLGAWLSGAKVERLVLNPLGFSRTDVVGGQWPRLVIWMGPVIGTAIPALLWLVAHRSRTAYVFRFFAGVCLISNGVYFASVFVQPIGDTADLLRAGESPWLMILFGLPCIAAGLACWSGLAPSFGFGKEAKEVSPRVALGVLTLLVVIVVVELALLDPGM